MIKNTYIVIVLLILTGCKDESNNVYFRNHLTEQIIKDTEYESLKDSLSQELSFNELIISKTNKGDSIITSYFLLKYPKGMSDPFENSRKIIGETIPIDSLTTLDGQKISLLNNDNKPTLLNFWFTSCLPCIEEMPELNKLEQEYDGRVNFISITFQSKQKVETLLKKHEFNFLHTVDAKKQMDTIKNSSYPLNLFINKDGTVSYVAGNSFDGGKLFRELLDNLL